MSLTPTPQTCTGNGQITINITNTEASAEFEFLIYQLPNTVTPIRVTSGIIATGSTLTHVETSLPAGNFRIVATQVVGVESNQQTRDVTITSNIQSLAFTASQTPLCTGASINVNVTAGNPASYELRTTANVVVIPAQASNVLTPVSAGSYNVIVTNVCGNSSSLGVTVVNDAAVYTQPTNINGFWTMQDCNNIRHFPRLLYNETNTIAAVRFPINVEIVVQNPLGGPNTIINQTWTSNANNSNTLALIPFYEGKTYNYTSTFTDNCGTVYTNTRSINATPSSRLLQPVASCGFRFLNLDQFRYYFAPVEVTFTNYPAGFDPANYNTNYVAGAYTHTFSSVPNSINFGNASSAGVPQGNYTIQITSCGRTETKTITVVNSVSYSMYILRDYSGCGDNEGSINFYIRSSTSATKADDLATVQITSAPAEFIANYGALPFDASSNIASNGEFYMNSLPAGNYTVALTGSCGGASIPGSFTIYDKSITSTITPTLNCGSFNVSASVTSYLVTEILWLQKYYPASGQWGHPTSGELYTEGTVINYLNGMFMNNNPVSNYSGYGTVTGTLNNIASTGQFRVMVQYHINSNGVSTLTNCRESLGTFNVPTNGISLNNYYVANCTSGNTELIIDAVGVPPLNYSITEFNGNPMSVNNGTNPIFTELAAGEYTVLVEDGCGNSAVFEFKTNVVKLPVIRPNNLCDGQSGSLFVTGLSFLTIEWTKDSDPTVIHTGNTLNFNPYNEATNAGTYSVHLTSSDGSSCIDETLTYVITSNPSSPNAGNDSVNNVCNSVNTLNLNDYLTGIFDTYGTWSEITFSGLLSGNLWDAASATDGTYQFKYTVNGLCSGTDEAIITINLQNCINANTTHAINDINNTYVDTPVSGNVLTNDFDLEGNTQTVSSNTNPTNGTVVVNADGTYTYTPNTDFVGTDSFTYTVCDNGTPQACDTAIVTINVEQNPTDTNNSVVANNDAVITEVGTPITISVLSNDFDPNGDVFTITTGSVTDPANGTVTVNADGTITYTPDPLFIGEDTFTYQICDNGTPQACETATVIVTVLPTNSTNTTYAVDDAYLINCSSASNMNLLDNDYDLEGNLQNIVITPITQPLHGTVTINTDGTFNYIVTGCYTGPDSFVYQVCDNGAPQACDEATVYLLIQDTTDPAFVEALPANATVECSAVPTAVVLTATDNCTTAQTVVYTETRTNGSCPNNYTLARVWTATDACGNVVSHTQTLTVQDTTAPVFVEALPADLVLECSDTIPAAATLTATDNCSTTMTVVFDEQRVDGSCANNYELIRTWTATDECGNETSHTQIIDVQDTTGPVFVEALPADAYANCDGIPVAPELTATDNCGTATVTYTETEVEGDCTNRYSLVREWTATDACGNQTTHTQTVYLACYVTVYNAVSANGDGSNDVFLIEGIECYPNNTIEIYNRWGVLVYESKGYNNTDKSFKGYSEGRTTISPNQLLPTGTYFYILKYEYDLYGTNQQNINKAGYLYLQSN